MIEAPLAVVLVLSLVVYAAVQLEGRFRLFRSLGGALVAILLGMLLSNLGVLPGISPMYGYLSHWGVNLGFALILLSVDLKTVVQAGPKMLQAFLLGAFGTMSGALLAGFLLADQIGEETWKLSGQYTGTYIGGGMNFAALGQALDTSTSLFTAAVAADVTVTAIWLAACLAAPVVLGRRSETIEAPEGGETFTLERSLRESGSQVTLVGLSALVCLALSAVWLAGFLHSLIPQIPQVLFLTTLVLLAGQIRATRSLPGGALIGNYLILLFLASNGAQSVLANIVSYGPAVFYFALLVVFVHGVLLFGLGRLFRIDLGTLAVASQANVGGAASAMALASARGYGDRLLPGVAVGLLGYALGNYAGFAVAQLLSWAL